MTLYGQDAHGKVAREWAARNRHTAAVELLDAYDAVVASARDPAVLHASDLASMSPLPPENVAPETAYPPPSWGAVASMSSLPPAGSAAPPPTPVAGGHGAAEAMSPLRAGQEAEQAGHDMFGPSRTESQQTAAVAVAAVRSRSGGSPSSSPRERLSQLTAATAAHGRETPNPSPRPLMQYSSRPAFKNRSSALYSSPRHAPDPVEAQPAVGSDGLPTRQPSAEDCPRPPGAVKRP